MYPILFRIGSYTAYSYTITLALGMVAGTWVAHRSAKTRLPDPSNILDAGFWALVGGILGGRAGYVIANWAYFGDHVDKALDLRGGGLSWHGALIGGCAAIAIWLAARGRFRPPAPGWRDLYDAIAPGLALGGAFGWLACLLTGAGYGTEATGYGPPLAWLTADLPDIYGVHSVRFLTQPLMIVWCLLLAGFLCLLSTKLPRGGAFGLYLLLYALADFITMFLRGDGTWYFGLWLSQWVAAAEACLALGLCIYAWARKGEE